MTGFVRNIGRAVLNFLASLGRITLFTSAAIRWTFFPPYYWRQLWRQTLDIGYFSLPVVGLTTLFSGMTGTYAEAARRAAAACGAEV